MKARIYHNPKCSKSRATLALLEERGIDVDVVEYLSTPVSKQALITLLDKLGLAAKDIVRTSEDAFKASGLSIEADQESLLDLIVEHPEILQRPIVEVGPAARIGRPPEQVLELLG